MCKNGPAAAFSTPQNSFIHAKVDYKAWNCPTCRNNKKQAWISHFTHVTKAEKVLYTATIDRPDWNTTYRTLPTNGWYKVESGQGTTLLVVATKPFQGCTPVRRKAALQATRDAVHALTKPTGVTKWVPVTTCRAWTIGTQNAKCQFVGWITKSAFLASIGEQIAKVLEKLDSMLVSIKTGEFPKAVLKLTETIIAKTTNRSNSDVRNQQQEHDDFWLAIEAKQQHAKSQILTLSG